MSGLRDRSSRRATGSALVIVVLLAGAGSWLLLRGEARQPQVIVVQARPTGDPTAPFAFDPPIVEVTAGSTVRWVNGSETFHTVTSSSSPGSRVSDGIFNESMFEEGATIERLFETPGEFSYFCQPHADFMAGQVMVLEG